jgi:hypothetical protein
MSRNGPLQDLVARHKALAMALARDFPEADEETLADTIEGASNLPQLLTAVLRSRLEDLSLAEALRGRLDTLRTRLDRLESRAEQKRVLVSALCKRRAFESWSRRISPPICVRARPN